MSDISARCQVPLIGIGGIVPENIHELIMAGASELR
ncbi:MAG: hypothetical protein Ct9H300mP11_11670 [Chloroflexota bacterium]|nr:MAG: hypothetical protein Ct9H300mP11_11670 [Chloroflexota bacterium]